MKRYILSFILILLPNLARADDRPLLTIRWMPLTLPVQLALHELSHAAVVPIAGGRVTHIGFFENGRFGEVDFDGIQGGLPQFAVSIAPRVLDALEMVVFTALHDSATEEDLRSFYNAVRLSAWVDFEFNTVKIVGSRETRSANDSWNAANGLGLDDGTARAASLTLAVGVGYLGMTWLF